MDAGTPAPYARQMRFGATIVAVVVALVFSLSACGGDDDAASDATVSSAALAGTWVDGEFVVRLTRDGTFSMDADGSLDDGEFVKGTYSVEGSRARFVADEQGPRGCGGQEWEWEIALSESGMLDAELLQEVCQTAAGTRWSLVKRPTS
jgi:hypothetical protein